MKPNFSPTLKIIPSDRSAALGVFFDWESISFGGGNRRGFKNSACWETIFYHQKTKKMVQLQLRFKPFAHGRSGLKRIPGHYSLFSPQGLISRCQVQSCDSCWNKFSSAVGKTAVTTWAAQADDKCWKIPSATMEKTDQSEMQTRRTAPKEKDAQQGPEITFHRFPNLK